MATGLFGQKYSSRDYTDRQYWGKNQFNSSFPASLVAYMWWHRMSLVYLNTTTGECLSGLEVKLTAIPDSTTIDRQEDE